MQSGLHSEVLEGKYSASNEIEEVLFGDYKCSDSELKFMLKQRIQKIDKLDANILHMSQIIKRVESLIQNARAVRQGETV